MQAKGVFYLFEGLRFESFHYPNLHVLDLTSGNWVWV